MEGLSPFTRRFLALGLLLVGTISALNLLVFPLALLLRQSLADLGDTRFQRSQLEAIVARPAPANGDAVPVSSYIQSATRTLASSQMEARVRGDAAATKVRLLSFNQQPETGGNTARLSAALSAEGDEVDLMTFIANLEQKAPLLRMGRWHIQRAAADAPLHLDAQLYAAWDHHR